MKSYALKDYEFIGKPGEASKNENGNQSCIVFENVLFSSRSKIIFQVLRAGSPIIALIETVSPRPEVIQTGSPLESV